jgi:amidase
MNRSYLRIACFVTALSLAACSDSQLADSSAKQKPLACDADRFDVLGGVDLQTATVLDVQQALDRRAFTSVELVRHQLDLIAAFDTSGPALNAVRALAPSALEQARDADARRKRGQLRGPLDGVTVLLKDNIGTTDLPTTAGSIALATNIPLREATITRRLREAGAIVLGKTNLSEFANWVSLTMPNGYSSLGGQVIAPYPPNADPSGSSSGSGVAGTMGFATVTVGSETAGSLISPSFRNSLVGVKPTLGLVSRTGIIPLAPSFDTAGPMTRTVTDAAALLGALAFADPEDAVSERFVEALNGEVPDYLGALSTTALQGVRLGVRELDTAAYGEAVQGPAVTLYLQTLEVLRAEGAELVTINDPLFAVESAPNLIEVGSIFNEFKFSLNRYLTEESGLDTFVETLSDIIAYNNEHPDEVKYGQDLLIASDAQTGSEIDPIYFASRETAILSAQAYFNAVMNFYDLDAIVGWSDVGGFDSNVGITAAAGYPNVAVPMGYYNSVPYGLAFAARAFEEAKLLAYAYDFEQATKARRSPPQINPELLAGCQR